MIIRQNIVIFFDIHERVVPVSAMRKTEVASARGQNRVGLGYIVPIILNLIASRCVVRPAKRVAHIKNTLSSVDLDVDGLPADRIVVCRRPLVVKSIPQRLDLRHVLRAALDEQLK